MATSGNISKIIIQSSQITITSRLKWSRKSYSVEDNTSTIEWAYQIESVGTGANNDSSTARAYSILINDQTYEGTVNLNITGNKTIVVDKGTLEIQHNNDGTISAPYKFNQKYPQGLSEKIATVYGSIDLEPIPRPATITHATPFNDEENPVITYSNPYGAAINSLQACIDGIAAYRAISKTDTTYTFALTDAEREALIDAMGTGTVATVRFTLKTVIEGVEFEDYITTTATLVNYKPTLQPTVKATDATTLKLTGKANGSILIKGVSTVDFDINAQGRKGADIEYRTITNGSVYLDDYTSDTGTIEEVNSNTFYFSATDTRGYTERAFVNFTTSAGTWIPYFNLTNSLSTQPMSATGSLTFTISGKYFNGSFGAMANELEVEYLVLDSAGNPVFNTSGSGWVVLGVVSPTVDSNGNYTYSHTITGLDHEGSYELTVNAIDMLTPVQSATTIIGAVPVFDWGKSDFHHHTDIKFSSGKDIIGTKADGTEVVALQPCDASGNTTLGYGNWDIGGGATNIYGNYVNLTANKSVGITAPDGFNVNNMAIGKNKILWQGANHMNALQTIILYEPIRFQANGVVLVFSYYLNNAAQDTGWSTFFVPKQMVELYNGGAQSFVMGLNAGFSLIGAKYLYIYDSSIQGQASNTSSGSNSGITYDNSKFVLRYVIGV